MTTFIGLPLPPPAFCSSTASLLLALTTHSWPELHCRHTLHTLLALKFLHFKYCAPVSMQHAHRNRGLPRVHVRAPGMPKCVSLCVTVCVYVCMYIYMCVCALRGIGKTPCFHASCFSIHLHMFLPSTEFLILYDLICLFYWVCWIELLNKHPSRSW